MTDPRIDQWRLVPVVNSLVGKVTGHPKLRDGWIITSTVAELNRDTRRARTQSRWYELGEELPSDKPLPAPGYDLLLHTLAPKVNTIEDIARLFEVVEHLAAPPGKPQ